MNLDKKLSILSFIYLHRLNSNQACTFLKNYSVWMLANGCSVHYNCLQQTRAVMKRVHCHAINKDSVLIFI